MTSYPHLDVSVLNGVKPVDEAYVDSLLKKELEKLNRKIVVLDDDPTGVQTVHGISVYTDWEKNSFEAGFAEKNSMFFILTNSRSFTSEETKREHTLMARRIAEVSRETGKGFIVISRSDSTMRGHYPLETETLKSVIEAEAPVRYDGEIIFPFFKEGGRYTMGNVHYVKQEGELVPAGETEFARDKTFGYRASSIPEWCEEKTAGRFKAENVACISLEALRALDFDGIQDTLMSVSGFNKIVVNSVDYVDVKIFAVALVRAILSGKEFMLRSAAAITKVLGGVGDKPLLTKDELVERGDKNGGVVIIGSHVMKTTGQLQELQKSEAPLEFITFDQHRVLEAGGLEAEAVRVSSLVEKNIAAGKTSVVFTRRDRFDLDTDDKEKQLKVSVEISDAVTSVVSRLKIKPSFIVAKGGITSSDVGTKALRVKKALVMGQIKPGIPVWMTGAESKFPNMPYVIFPGNVGEMTTLREIVELLSGFKK